MPHAEAPARHFESELDGRLRATLIRSHCARETGAHQCAAAITITRTDITMNCRPCGDLRQTLVNAE